MNIIRQRRKEKVWGHVIFTHVTVQWTLANPNSLGPGPIQISEIFGLVKGTAAMCVIVTAPYLRSALGSLGSCLCCTFTEHTTLLPNYLYTSCAKHDQILIIDQLVDLRGFGLTIRINEGPLYTHAERGRSTQEEASGFH